MKRMAFVTQLKPDMVKKYRELHAAVWPDVLAQLARANITNYSIFLREPERLLVGYWEYRGEDFEADMAKIAADPKTQEWWTFTDPCQEPLASSPQQEIWAPTELVFHMD